MSAIFGFSGHPWDPHLSKLQAQLHHRGDHSEYITTAYATAGVCWHLYENNGSRTRRIAQRGKDYCLISGNCRDPEGARLTADDLLKQLDRDDGGYPFKGVTGDFTIAIIRPEEILVCRDGAGTRAVYFSVIRDRLFFASEPKAISALPEFDKKLRKGALIQYLTFSFIPGKETFLEGLLEVPPGHYLRFDKTRLPKLIRHFSFEHLEDERQMVEDEWIDLFHEKFAKAVFQRIPPDKNRMGLFLSGGIDSSIVAAQLSAKTDQKLKTFSIHFGKDYPNELPFARMVAAHCNTDHHEIEIRANRFLDRLRKMIWHLDDPIGDPITMPNFELSGIVAQQVDYVFNGEGGDPLFGGPKNLPLLLLHWYGGHPKEKYFRELAYLQSYQRAFEDLANLLTSDYYNEALVQTELIDVLTPFFNCETPTKFLNKLMAINIRLKGAHLILPKVERMTGAWGLTPLSPLFDEELIRMSFRMPPTLKLKNGIEKMVLKKAFAQKIPQPVIDRPKSGMRVPVHFWFKKEMRKYCKSLLSRKNIERAGIFRYERIKQLIDYDIAEGRSRYGLRLWMIMTFEIWRKMVIENES